MRLRPLGLVSVLVALSLAAPAVAQPPAEAPVDPPAPLPPSEPPTSEPAPPAPAAPTPPPPMPPEPSGALFELKDGPRTLFGQRGQVLLDNSLLASLALISVSSSGLKLNVTEIDLQPSLGYFFVDQVFVKLQPVFRRSTQSAIVERTNSGGLGVLGKVTETTLGGGLGLGYDMELAWDTSLLPTIGLQYRRVKSDASGNLPSHTRTDELLSKVSVHFLYHPAAHVYLGLGPAYTFTIHSKRIGPEPIAPSYSIFEATAIVGVWW